jgi:DNA-binding response OmpR family regulator
VDSIPKSNQLILVCDDEPHIRHLITSKLRESGFEVMEGRDGQEGLELATRRTPELVLTDFQMPRMSGLDLAQALKKDSTTRATPVIMLTARGYVLSEEELATTGVVALMPKPFGVRQLMNRVREVLAAGPANRAAA